MLYFLLFKCSTTAIPDITDTSCSVLCPPKITPKSNLLFISLLFLNEILNNIYNEIPHGYINAFIFWAYESIYIYLKSNNNNLKIGAEKLIKELAETIPSEATIISLIKSLNEKNENILNFIFNCIELYFKEFISYGLNFNFIFERLEINNIINDKDCKDYYLKIKKAFILLKKIIESEGMDINFIIEGLDEINKVFQKS